MKTSNKNASVQKDSKSLAIELVNDFFKTAKDVKAFNGDVTVDVVNYNGCDEIRIKTNNGIFMIDTLGYICVQLNHSLLNAMELEDIAFIYQNVHSIVHAYRIGKEAA